MRKPLLTLLLGLLLGTGVSVWWVLAQRSASRAPKAVQAAAPVLAPARFVGSEACRGCHSQAFAAWQGSQHARSMQPARDDTVLGDFANQHVREGSVQTTFFRRGGGFWVRTDGEDGKPAEFQVKYTFGVYPLQQVLLELPRGRLQALSIAWDARPRAAGGQRWFHLYAGQGVRAGDALHWTGREQNWNTMCAACHSTDVRKGYDRQQQAFATEFSELAVGCEACHGAGSQHLAWAKAKSSGQPLAIAHKGWSAQPGHVSDACGACHGRRSQLVEPPGHGQPLHDTHRPALLAAGLYHADGQQLAEVFTWGSFVQSKMHAAGVTCGNCHAPHSASLRLPGNALCGQCHAPATFDGPQHHHQAVGSAAAACTSCHMPTTNYMSIDARHDHSFRVPRPDDAVTAAMVAGRAGSADFEGRARAVLMAAGTAPIKRATLLSLLPPDMAASTVEVVAKQLSDADPDVRAAAVGALSGQPAELRWRLALGLLTDRVRLVRVSAATLLADLPPAQRQAAPGWAKALQEALAAEQAQAERPEACINLASLFAALGQPAEAEKALREALAIDPASVPARVNLADLYRQLGRDGDAEPLLRQAMRLQPAAAAPVHALGLLLARRGDARLALQWLGRAAALDAANIGYGYVHAIALHEAGQAEAAIRQLEGLHQRASGDRRLLEALIAMHQARGDNAASAAYAAKLQQLNAP